MYREDPFYLVVNYVRSRRVWDAIEAEIGWVRSGVSMDGWWKLTWNTSDDVPQQATTFEPHLNFAVLVL